MSTSFGLNVQARSGTARAGVLQTPHGDVATPAFVPVATQAAVKALPLGMVRDTRSQLLFANTYHLFLRPGADVVAQHGGLHRFMGWDRPMLTDSGGFQVFSLGAGIEHGVGKVASIFPGEGGPRPTGESGMVKVGEHGVVFTSHIDGSRHEFTPERSIDVQRRLGADMIIAFDECTSPLHDESYTRESADRTHRWAERSLQAFKASSPLHGYDQELFGVVQGGAFESVRRESTQVIAGMGFGGIAIGGNLGDSKEAMYRVIEWTVEELGDDPRPRHLLGIGDVPSVWEGAARGVDTFDCVAPTRNARNGGLLKRFDDDGAPLPQFRINVKNARYAEDTRPVDEACGCSTCQNHSRAYLRHLFKAGEQLGPALATVHNLHFMSELMEAIRTSIHEGRFEDEKRAWLEPTEAVSDSA